MGFDGSMSVVIPLSYVAIKVYFNPLEDEWFFVVGDKKFSFSGNCGKLVYEFLVSVKFVEDSRRAKNF